MNILVYVALVYILVYALVYIVGCVYQYTSVYIVQLLSLESLQMFQSPKVDKRHKDNTSSQSLQQAIVHE